MYVTLLQKAMEFPALRDILNNVNTTCFTDAHKGSESALRRVCELTEDRSCVEHIIKKLGPIGVQGRFRVYEAAKAPDEATFTHHMEELKRINSRAYTKLHGTPHDTWANHRCRKNVTWDQTTSNMAESINNMIGAEAREKSVLGFLNDIVLQTARRVDAAANLKKDDPSAVITPFATKTFNTELKWLHVTPSRGGRYHVEPHQNSRMNNEVNLTWRGTADAHVYDCSCGWCEKFKIPCRHVLAVTKATGTCHRALELVDAGYSLAKYRAAANNPNYRVVPPVFSRLTVNPDHHPPAVVTAKAGRPNKGPRKKARIMSNGEQNSSSRNYALMNAASRRVGGVGIPPQAGHPQVAVEKGSRDG